jgi:hypothetical protein
MGNMGTAVFILETIVVILSVLAAFGALQGPALARTALAFCALFLVPGISLSALLFGSRASIVEGACRIFSMGLVFVSAVVCAGFVPGVSYPAISIAASALAIGLAFLARRSVVPGWDGARAGSRGEAMRSRVSGRSAAIAGAGLFALCVLLFAGTGELGWNTDALDHVSFVGRSVESGSLFPRDSYYREGDGISPDPRKGLWHPVLSLWTFQAREPAYRVWRDIPAFLSFFAACAFLLFAIRLTGSARGAALSLVFFLLFYGGEGIGWFTKIGFSKNVAQIALWIDLAFLFTYYATGRRIYLLAGAFLACVGAAFHVVFAMLLGVSLAGIFLYVTLVKSGAGWRGAFWRSLPLQIAGAAVPLAIRSPAAFAASTTIHTHLQGMLVFSPGLAIVDPAELATRYGLVFFFVLALAPFFWLVAERAERRSLAFMLYAVPVILVLDPLVAFALERRIGYLHYRLLDAAPIVVLLALIVGGLAERLATGRTGARWAERSARPILSARGIAGRIVAAAILAVFIAYPLRSVSRGIAGPVRTIIEKPSPIPPRYASLFSALDEAVPDRAVIASDPVTSYILSAFTDHFVTVILDQHCSPADTSAMERLREARNLLSPAVPFSASRAWLARTGASYVLVDAEMPGRADFFNSFLPGEAAMTCEKLGDCPAVSERVLDLDGFHLFRLRTDDRAAFAEKGCDSALAGALPCPAGDAGGGDGPGDGGMDVGENISLANLAVDNYLLRSGDTLSGHFCWKAERKPAFGFPLDVIVRIETSFPKGRLYRDWYGKQYRRIVERRRGAFYRYTWRIRLMSGPAYPDMWEAGRAVRQDFSLRLPASIAPGPYEVRVMVMRAPYLENRSVADYLSNDDSLEGVPVGMIYLRDDSKGGGSGRGGGTPPAREAR